ncbi:MAG: SAM-dependent methyltransferase [Microthrixaceae bacterium]
MQIGLTPIGTVVGGRLVPEDDGWDAETCEIRLDPTRFDESSLAGLDAFSHVEVVYHFHLVDEVDVVATARHPRGRTDWPAVGIFAQRGRVRPNRLGVSVARLLGVDGMSVRVRGLDAVAGTPVLDLKPVLSGFLPRGEVVEPTWSVELMSGYWDGPELDNPAGS